MKKLFLLSLCAVTMMVSCTKEQDQPTPQDGAAITRATAAAPKLISYVEINDTNPLNVGSYYMGAKPFYDIAILFAANIHVDSYGNPALYFNDKLAPVMADVAKYVKPLQAKGIKVSLSILGDHTGLGVANMTDDQAEKFASILAEVVTKYGLDGIDFDDEYAKYGENGFPYANSTSYSNLINKLRGKLTSDKLVTVFDWGNADTIDATAAGNLSYAWQGAFGPSNYRPTSIASLPNSKWSPQALNLRSNYNVFTLKAVAAKSTLAKNEGMGAIMTYDIRKASEKSPLPVLKKIAEGAFAGAAVTYNGEEFARDIVPVPAGKTITFGDLPL